MKGFFFSFLFAFRGIVHACSGRNFRIQLAIGLAVVTFGFYFDIAKTEWLIVLVFTGLVPAFEIVNTAIEECVNLISPEFHPAAGKIKDLAAGAVLLLSMTAAIVGAVIFVPYIIESF